MWWYGHPLKMICWRVVFLSQECIHALHFTSSTHWIWHAKLLGISKIIDNALSGASTVPLIQMQSTTTATNKKILAVNNQQSSKTWKHPIRQGWGNKNWCSFWSWFLVRWPWVCQEHTLIEPLLIQHLCKQRQPLPQLTKKRFDHRIDTGAPIYGYGYPWLMADGIEPSEIPMITSISNWLVSLND